MSNNQIEKATQNTPNVTAHFAVVEAYKMIRTNLLFLLSQTNEKIITVSSSIAGEGKSTTAINIAVAFSQLGSRVLLIDSDMRKPSVHKKLRLSNKVGISSLLVGFSQFEETVNHINDNFDVITSGPTPPNPSELLGSDKMASLLKELNEKYDYIVLDTPPVNIVPDALVVAPHTAGIVFVVRDFITTHEQFQKALSSIEFAGVRFLGSILNGHTNKVSRRYKYRYRYRYNSYGYYNYK
ncbi:MAG: CpsD/CapB family tyrosine-protein kinase [Clostridia bacterium]|nr:CpsD/CapB family tyrosine-protein kinase [Oscillospiraceae bacterium]MBR6693599.1 CpsD/CapB family tyrosine-protein kinase [Clostridia bacterium]